MSRYPETSRALHRWAGWWLPQLDGHKAWSTDSILSQVIEYGIIPGGEAGKSRPLTWRFERQEKMTHFAVVRLSRHFPDLGRVVVVHYLMPGEVNHKRHEVRLSERKYYDHLLQAQGWLDGVLVGLNAA